MKPGANAGTPKDISGDLAKAAGKIWNGEVFFLLKLEASSHTGELKMSEWSRSTGITFLKRSQNVMSVATKRDRNKSP